jgi:hypothetical protein
MPRSGSGHVESLFFFFFSSTTLINKTELGLSPHALHDAMALI